jgi:hypothetical protein
MAIYSIFRQKNNITKCNILKSDYKKLDIIQMFLKERLW